VSPAATEQQVSSGAANSAHGKIHGPLGDTAPQRAGLSLGTAVRAGTQLRLISATLDKGSYTTAASRSGGLPRRRGCD
jgi:hypothetical protein